MTKVQPRTVDHPVYGRIPPIVDVLRESFRKRGMHTDGFIIIRYDFTQAMLGACLRRDDRVINLASA